MDFGFARFLEMFEARFGKTATTLLMAALAVAVVAWAIQTTTEAVVYIYKLVKQADFLGVLRTEHAATHLVIFAVQIVVTFVILAFIWQWFFRRRLKAFVARFQGYKSEWQGWEKKFEEHMVKHRSLMQVFALTKDAVEKTRAATELVRDEINKKLAENPQLKTPPIAPPIQEPPEKR